MFLASRGLRDMGQGPEQILDMEFFLTLLNQARSVMRRSILYGLILSLLTLLL